MTVYQPSLTEVALLYARYSLDESELRVLHLPIAVCLAEFLSEDKPQYSPGEGTLSGCSHSSCNLSWSLAA